MVAGRLTRLIKGGYKLFFDHSIAYPITAITAQFMYMVITIWEAHLVVGAGHEIPHYVTNAENPNLDSD